MSSGIPADLFLDRCLTPEERSGSCKHLARNRMTKTYLKCELNRARWTGGYGSDVRARDAACKKWEKPDAA